jgi:hypothetical protein
MGKILIVDDDKLIVSALSIRLRPKATRPSPPTTERAPSSR